MKRAILICGAAALALAACSKKTTETVTAKTTRTVDITAAAPAAAPAGPMSLPTRKAGLWEQTVNTGQMHQTVSMCLDAAFDRRMKVWGGEAGKNGCTEERINPHLGGGWDFHSVCPMGESGTVTSDGSATGDFGSHYTVAVTSTTAGSPMAQANGAHKVNIEATWKGPCPPDMKPGDMALPGGMRINMGEAMSGGAAGASGHMTSADMARMRAQAMEMKKQMEATKP
ncbi:MAG TPA: DUF3617 family protein [Phenylobacterium sp.]|jgi:hypothetical protein|uniref:DUF3617 domain-containing protein n=1 Tax=Phenylobacterium sp. TaxID=1871053 RepID=UPI002B627A91|nr:DUF3617 family protein [Phenylobacterium sp.]HXA40062.1 DUF3617 family protein [Phenylobacterium sp.]